MLQLVQRGIQHNLQEPSMYAEWLKVSNNGGVYFNDYCNWKKIPEFQEYIYNSPAAELAGNLMCSEWVKFYHEHVLNKEPGAEKATPWHHDQSYYPINGDKVCSIWMPVDPVSLDSTLRLVCGSHRWGRWFKPRKFATESDYISDVFSHTYESVPVEEIESGKYHILQWAMQPGDCVVFHMRTVHGAAGNSSATHQRRVLATRWLGEDACISTRPWKESPPNDAVFTKPPSLEQLPTIWRLQK
ncbi:probable phytanoyl-CoA dioxygenase isoform X2 [Cryptotermes secundus]|uniref:probable phytanoyl-CoA dioxygenase isoform X2 n=1 Tax=Cryptotermes secundus TaxID=105785 RepID=UPI001454DD92|nr:probable phytanoyl-CoA dioxygenase isoform X2 [Cryptotermes secundus]